MPVGCALLYRFQSQLGGFATLQCYLPTSFRLAKFLPERERSLARSALLAGRRPDYLTISLPFTRCDRGTGRAPLWLRPKAAPCLSVEFLIHYSG